MRVNVQITESKGQTFFLNVFVGLLWCFCQACVTLKCFPYFVEHFIFLYTGALTN